MNSIINYIPLVLVLINSIEVEAGDWNKHEHYTTYKGTFISFEMNNIKDNIKDARQPLNSAETCGVQGLYPIYRFDGTVEIKSSSFESNLFSYTPEINQDSKISIKQNSTDQMSNSAIYIFSSVKINKLPSEYYTDADLLTDKDKENLYLRLWTGKNKTFSKIGMLKIDDRFNGIIQPKPEYPIAFSVTYFSQEIIQGFFLPTWDLRSTSVKLELSLNSGFNPDSITPCQ